jgi:hypothetical protein
MALIWIGGDPDCVEGRDCPNAYVTDRGTVAVQGTDVSSELGRDIPSDEGIVEIPPALFDAVLEAIRVARR